MSFTVSSCSKVCIYGVKLYYSSLPGHATRCVILSDFLFRSKHSSDDMAWTDDDGVRCKGTYSEIVLLYIDWLMHFL